MSNYTKPELRKRVVARIKAGTKAVRLVSGLHVKLS